MDAAAGCAHGQRRRTEVRRGAAAAGSRRTFVAGILAALLAPAGRARGGPGPQGPHDSRVLTVGPGRGRDFATIASAAMSARDRDIVEIDAGDYVDDVTVWSQNQITIRSVGGPARISSVARTAEGKAIFVVKGTDVAIEGIEFSGAEVPSQNGAGIRHEGGLLTVRDCVFERNEMGLLTWNSPAAEVVVERCEFRHNAVRGRYQPGGESAISSTPAASGG